MRATDLPHTNASIRVNGQPLQEHQLETVANGHSRASACFVEAVPDAEFDVELDLQPNLRIDRRLKREDYLLFSVYLDGKKAAGYTLPQKDYVTRHGKKIAIDSVKDIVKGNHVQRKFKFAQLQTTDEKPEASQMNALAQLGEVKVELVRCQKVGTELRTKIQGSTFSVSDTPISEKALKGRSMSSQARLGDAVPSYAPSHYSIMKYTYGREPLATWIFRYRTRRDLQIEGIIGPDIPLEERNPDDLTPDEARELIRRMRAREHAPKPEHSSTPQKKVPAKQEASTQHGGSVKREHAIMIADDDFGDDLDDDDFDFDISQQGSATALASPQKRAKIEIECVDLTDI